MTPRFGEHPAWIRSGCLCRHPPLPDLGFGGRSAPPALLPSPCAVRMVVPRVAQLAPHRIASVPPSEPDLILRANRVAPEMDVVLHLHGYSTHGTAIRLADKEAVSGLDFCNPAAPREPGRARPTLGLLPRGKPETGRKYTFPALLSPGAIDALVTLGLARIGGGGLFIRRARFILTGHSGGGRPVELAIPLLGEELSEVHVFDGLYWPSPRIARWALDRMARDAEGVRRIRRAGGGGAEIANYMRARGSALRVIHRTGDHPPNTEGFSAELARRIAAGLRRAGDVAPWLCRYYRVEATRIDHNQIPRFFGFRLLRDAGGDVPSTFVPVPTCARPASRRPGMLPSQAKVVLTGP